MTAGDTPPTGDPPPTAPNLDALTCHVALWADLPAPSSLHVVTSTGERAWFTASRSRASAARAAHEAVFGPTEYEALVVAALEQRVTIDDVVRFVRRKLEQPTAFVDPREAVAGALSLVVQVGDPKKANAWRIRPELLGRTTWARALELLGLRCELVVTEVASVVDEAAAAAALEAM